MSIEKLEYEIEQLQDEIRNLNITLEALRLNDLARVEDLKVLTKRVEKLDSHVSVYAQKTRILANSLKIFLCNLAKELSNLSTVREFKETISVLKETFDANDPSKEAGAF